MRESKPPPKRGKDGSVGVRIQLVVLILAAQEREQYTFKTKLIKVRGRECTYTQYKREEGARSRARPQGDHGNKTKGTLSRSFHRTESHKIRVRMQGIENKKKGRERRRRWSGTRR